MEEKVTDILKDYAVPSKHFLQLPAKPREKTSQYTLDLIASLKDPEIPKREPTIPERVMIGVIMHAFETQITLSPDVAVWLQRMKILWQPQAVLARSATRAIQFAKLWKVKTSDRVLKELFEGATLLK